MVKKIYKWSLPYALGRLHVRLAFRLFYRSIEVRGLENLPKGVPVILAPNHQNALMDALAAVHGLRGVQVFVARADIFRNKLAAKILHFVKIMPVFRMRDGYENLGKNDETFYKTIEVLQKGRIMCIMPEGTHSEFRQLRPLVKGIFRLAFKYIEENPEKPAPQVVPVGLDYSSYSKYRSHLVVNYGKPIDSAAFYEKYKKNPAEGINSFRDALAESLKTQMIHIESKEHYAKIDLLRELLRPLVIEKLKLPPRQPFSRFVADKWFTEKCNALNVSNSNFFNNIEKHILCIATTLGQQKVETSNFTCKGLNCNFLIIRSLIHLLFLPVFLVGYLYHALLLRAPRLLTNKIEDVQFHSSVKFMLVCFLFPLWYLTFGVVFYLLFHSILLSLVLLLSLAVAGELSYWYYVSWKALKAELKQIFYKERFKQARFAYNAIVSEFRANNIF